MKYRGIPACSIELNPYLFFVSTVKTRSYGDLAAIDSGLRKFMKAYRAVHHVPKNDRDAEKHLKENEAFIPPIHNPERWWSPGNLAQLSALRRLLLEYAAKPEILDLIRMGILGTLIPVSNAKHNHVSLTFAEHPLKTIDVAEMLDDKYRQMILDLRTVAELPRSEVCVFAGNSKNAASLLPKKPKVSAIITSPPYPNRLSYARETRPHLFFFDFIKDAKAVGKLETDAIGGTWGKATSDLAKGILPINDVVRDLLSPYTGSINGSGALMASYVTKYFNDVFIHAGEMQKVCKTGAKLAYVIGNSKFYDHPLPSDEILAAVFGHFGFELDRIDRMRRRQSKIGLYEAVVFMAAR
jgi:hypothetical protein